MKIAVSEIRVEDKRLFDQYKSTDILNSEYQFTTIFAWADTYQFHYKLYNNFIIVFGEQSNAHIQCYYPIGNGDLTECMEHIRECFCVLGQAVNIRPLSEAMLNQLRPYFSETALIDTKPSYTDYIYSLDALRTYAGSEYKRKRKLTKHFYDNYKFEYEEISSSTAMGYFNSLCHILRLSGKVNRDEQRAYYRMLSNFDGLGLRGCAVRINGTVQGICVAEECGEQILVHIRRCNKMFVGIYPAILQLLLCRAFENTEANLVNLQDDVGLIGLRKAKLSYHPSMLLKKYFIYEG